jgi:hypothetical protein
VILGSLVVIAADLRAQSKPAPQPAPARPAQAPRIPRAAASTRASVAVLIDSRWGEGGWFTALNLAGPAKIAIDYGQPHARGRNVVGMAGVMPWDSVWRAGANMSTQLTAEVDITIGNAFNQKWLEADRQQGSPAMGYRLRSEPGFRAHRSEIPHPGRAHRKPYLLACACARGSAFYDLPARYSEVCVGHHRAFHRLAGRPLTAARRRASISARAFWRPDA